MNKILYYASLTDMAVIIVGAVLTLTNVTPVVTYIGLVCTILLVIGTILSSRYEYNHYGESLFIYDVTKGFAPTCVFTFDSTAMYYVSKGKYFYTINNQRIIFIRSYLRRIFRENINLLAQYSIKTR